MKKSLWVGLSVILSISTVYFWSKEKEQKEIRLKEGDRNQAYIRDLLGQYSSFLNANINVYSVDEKIEISKPDLQTLTAKEWIKESDKVVIWISNRHCSECVDQLLERVKGYTGKWKNLKMVLLTSNENGNDYFQLVKARNIAIETYSVTPSFLPTEIRDNTNPSIFLLKKDGVLNSVYSVSSTYLDGINNYLNAIKAGDDINAS